MAKIRHIAYRAEDTEAMARFFVEAFEMEIAQNRPNGAIDLTDGTLNITILPANGPGASGKVGIDHMGFTVADEAELCLSYPRDGGPHRREPCDRIGAQRPDGFVERREARRPALEGDQELDRWRARCARFVTR